MEKCNTLLTENKKLKELIIKINDTIYKTDSEKYTDGQIVDIIAELIKEKK